MPQHFFTTASPFGPPIRADREIPISTNRYTLNQTKRKCDRAHKIMDAEHKAWVPRGKPRYEPGNRTRCYYLPA